VCFKGGASGVYACTVMACVCHACKRICSAWLNRRPCVYVFISRRGKWGVCMYGHGMCVMLVSVLIQLG